MLILIAEVYGSDICSRVVRQGVAQVGGRVGCEDDALLQGYSGHLCRSSLDADRRAEYTAQCITPSSPPACEEIRSGCGTSVLADDENIRFRLNCSSGVMKGWNPQACLDPNGIVTLDMILSCCKLDTDPPKEYQSTECRPSLEKDFKMLTKFAPQCAPGLALSEVELHVVDDVSECSNPKQLDPNGKYVRLDYVCKRVTLEDPLPIENNDVPEEIEEGLTRLLPADDHSLTNTAVAVVLGGAITLSPVSIGALGSLMVISTTECVFTGNDTKVDALTWMFHPCCFPIGDSVHRYYMGAVVFNSLLCVVFAGVAYVLQCVRCARVGASGVLVVPVVFLCPGVVTSAGVMSFFNRDAPLGVGVVGITALAVSVLLPFVLWRCVLQRRVFEASMVEDEDSTSQYYRFFYGKHIWASPSSTSSFLDLNRAWFEMYRSPHHSFLLSELLLLITLSICSVCSSSPSTPCTIKYGVMGIALLIFFCYLLKCRPYAGLFQNIVMSVVYMCLLGATLCLGVSLVVSGEESVPKKIARIFALAGAYLLSTKTIIEIVMHFVEGRARRARSAFLVSDTEDRTNVANASEGIELFSECLAVSASETDPSLGTKPRTVDNSFTSPQEDHALPPTPTPSDLGRRTPHFKEKLPRDSSIRSSATLDTTVPLLQLELRGDLGERRRHSVAFSCTAAVSTYEPPQEEEEKGGGETSRSGTPPSPVCNIPHRPEDSFSSRSSPCLSDNLPPSLVRSVHPVKSSRSFSHPDVSMNRPGSMISSRRSTNSSFTALSTLEGGVRPACSPTAGSGVLYDMGRGVPGIGSPASAGSFNSALGSPSPALRHIVGPVSRAEQIAGLRQTLLSPITTPKEASNHSLLSPGKAAVPARRGSASFVLPL